MDKQLNGLYISLVESPRAKYFVISDGETEGDLVEIKDSTLSNIPNIVNRALANYIDKINRKLTPTWQE